MDGMEGKWKLFGSWELRVGLGVESWVESCSGMGSKLGRGAKGGSEDLGGLNFTI